MVISYQRIIKIFRIFPFLALFDCISTIWGLFFGGKEANDLPAFFLNNWRIPGFVVYEISVFIGLILLSNFLIVRKLEVFKETQKVNKLFHIIVIIIFYYSIFCHWLSIIIMNFLYPINFGILVLILPFIISSLSALILVFYSRNEIVPLAFHARALINESMKSFDRDLLYLPLLGILSSLLILTLLYRSPSYSFVLIESDFVLRTEGGDDLGRSFSSITIECSPEISTFSLIPEHYTFLFSVHTQISELPNETSVFSSNLYYNVSLILNSKFVDRIVGNYLGSPLEDADRNLFYAIRLPSHSHPLIKVRDAHGILKLGFRGGFYNYTEKTFLEEGRSEIRVFKLHPFSRILSFLILFSIIIIRTIDRNRSIYRLKNIWD